MIDTKDIAELVGRLAYLAERNAGTFVGDMFREAADAMDAQAREVARLIRAWEAKQHSATASNAEAEIMFRLAQEVAAERDELRAEVGPALLRALQAEAQIARMAPVVEAARDFVSHGIRADMRPTTFFGPNTTPSDVYLWLCRYFEDGVESTQEHMRRALANLEAAHD